MCSDRKQTSGFPQTKGEGEMNTKRHKRTEGLMDMFIISIVVTVL